MEDAGLKHVALEVRVWRRNHPSEAMSGMPVDLQCNVVKLLESHSWDEVCEAVGIGRSSLSILRKRHRAHLQLRRRVAPPKRERARRRTRPRSDPKKAELRLARVVRRSSTENTGVPDNRVAHDGKLVVELGGVRVDVLDDFTPSTLVAVLDVVETWRRRSAR